MNERERPGPVEPEGESRLRELLQAAGPRPAPPDAMQARVRAGAHEEWQRTLARRRRTRLVRSFGLVAAALVVTALVVTLVGREDQPPARSARLAGAELVAGFGSLRIAAQDPFEQGRPGAVPGALERGQWLVTGVDSGARLELPERVSLRVDANTRVRIEDEAGLLRLESGRIYVDSEDSPYALRVMTGLGVVEDIGTQFEVSVHAGRLGARVRDGVVRVRSEDAEEVLERGETLVLERGSPPSRASVAPTDASWEWTSALARPPAEDVASVHALASWFARERGYRLAYEDSALAEEASQVQLRGDLAALPREQMLEIALSTTSFEARVEKDVLVLGRRR